MLSQPEALASSFAASSELASQIASPRDFAGNRCLKCPVLPSRACYFQSHSGGCLLPCGRGASKLQTRTAQLVAGANVQAAMPVRLFPRPARRALAVSAAIGRFDRTPHHTGAAEPATAAAPAAPDVAAPAELPLRVGRKRKAPSSPDVVSRSLPVKATAVAPHACADAQGCDSGSDCTALRCAAVCWKALCCAALRLHCTCTAPCSALAVVAVVYAHCKRAHAALGSRLVMWKRW